MSRRRSPCPPRRRRRSRGAAFPMDGRAVGRARPQTRSVHGLDVAMPLTRGSSVDAVHARSVVMTLSSSGSFHHMSARPTQVAVPATGVSSATTAGVADAVDAGGAVASGATLAGAGVAGDGATVASAPHPLSTPTIARPARSRVVEDRPRIPTPWDAHPAGPSRPWLGAAPAAGIGAVRHSCPASSATMCVTPRAASAGGRRQRRGGCRARHRTAHQGSPYPDGPRGRRADPDRPPCFVPSCRPAWAT